VLAATSSVKVLVPGVEAGTTYVLDVVSVAVRRPERTATLPGPLYSVIVALWPLPGPETKEITFES
jgi:hypothetical protein